MFIYRSIKVVSETSKNNFSYAVKFRDTIEEVDKIVERAQVNINVLADAVAITYNDKKLYSERYNLSVIKNFDLLTKAALVNSPGVDGIWFQGNVDLPFSNKIYIWYSVKNGKIINLKEKIFGNNPHPRRLTPENDPYYFEAVRNKTITWSDVYRDTDVHMDMISVSEPIYKNNKLIGVVGFDITLDNLQNALKSMQSVIDGSEIFLLNDKHLIVLEQLNSNKKVDKYFFLKLFQKKFNKNEETVEFIDGGVRKSAILLSLSNKYNVVVTFPNTLIFKGFDNLFKILFFIFFLLFVLGVLDLQDKLKIKRINFELESEKNKLRTIVDLSPSIILLKNLDGFYIDCNRNFLDLMKITKEDYVGKTDEELFSAEEVIDIRKNDKIAIESKQSVVTDYCYKLHNDEVIYVEKHIMPILDKNNEVTGLLIIAFDITKQKLTHDLLKTAKDDAEKTAVMKSNFLANMSHEIRTPLNGVIGFIQLLKDTNLTKEQAEFIEDAQKSSEILLNVLNEILDFSKIEAEKLIIENTSFDIRSLVEDITIVSTANSERKGLEVNSLICSDVPQKLFGDPARIKQVLNNLVGNAVKFTQSGEIVIYVKQISEDDDKSILCFEVKDTGIGIPEDKFITIFEEFTQADTTTTRKYGGTGLGLAICKKLVKLMGGEIKVESKINEGSIFSFTLPLEKDKNSDKDACELINSLNGSKILVVSDNQTDLKIINYYLNEANCIINEASSCAEAINIINSDNSNISVIILNYKIQNEKEEDFNQLMKNSINIPKLLYIPLAQIVDYARAKEIGFSACLAKPIKRMELIETISNLIYGNSAENSDFIHNCSKNDLYFNPDLKILVVEDSKINTKLISKILANNGLTPDIVFDGYEAIEAFKAKQYDLILMDCQMPVMDGYKATEEIRKLEGGLRHTPIIAMTANVLSKDEQKCYNAGMDGYIKKPIEISSLLGIINKYILNSYPVNQRMSDDIDEPISISNIIDLIVSELGFDKEDAVQIISEYIEHIPANIYEFESYIDKNNFKELSSSVHKLKGASANLRAKKMASLCQALENAASKENKALCVSIVNDLHERYLHLKVSFLNEFCVHN